MKIKLSQITIDISRIKQLHNKPKKLYAGMGKDIRPNYCIEFKDGTFTEITKQEYKMLDNILQGVDKE